MIWPSDSPITITLQEPQETKSNMSQGDDEEVPPIILETLGWKRRSGFGKFSESVGVGSAWERRRFVLTSKKVSYYKIRDDDASKPQNDATPRGSLDILFERATIMAAYISDASHQPTPYAISIKTPDVVSGSESTKWKLCFDDRETQLLWLVAMTDIVAEATVKEFNARVLSSQLDKSHHGAGFHRLYEEGNGKTLDLVHGALLSGGYKREASENIKEEGIEVIEGSTRKLRLMTAQSQSAVTLGRADTTSPTSVYSRKFFSNDSEEEEDKPPMEKLYKALVVVLLAFFYEKSAEKSSSLIWQLVNVVILCICFAPMKSADDKKGDSNADKGSDTIKLASPNKRVQIKEDAEEVSPLKTPRMTTSMVGTALMQAEGVPLSDMPSERFPSEKTGEDGDDQSPHRMEPLTEDEMGSHLHERWAMSAPNVDISGEWTLIADDKFKAEYDTYLKELGFSGITRRVACSLIARTTEITKQSDNGRELYLKGTNPKGAWERTLTSSGYPDFETQPEQKEGEDFTHTKTSIKTADSEDVDAEAWWEDKGAKHRSWLRGGKKYGGGDFESLRYLEDGSDGSILVCESFFHPKDATKKKAVVNWRFQRDGATGES